MKKKSFLLYNHGSGVSTRASEASNASSSNNNNPFEISKDVITMAGFNQN